MFSINIFRINIFHLANYLLLMVLVHVDRHWIYQYISEALLKKIKYPKLCHTYNHLVLHDISHDYIQIFHFIALPISHASAISFLLAVTMQYNYRELYILSLLIGLASNNSELMSIIVALAYWGTHSINSCHVLQYDIMCF